MRKLLLSFAIWGFSFSANAEVLDKPNDIIKAVQAGKKGAWLDDLALRKCLENTKMAESLNQEIKILNEQQNLCLNSIKILSEQKVNYDARITEMEKYTKDLQKYNDKIEEDLKKWYHNPWFMSVLGAVAGTISTTAIMIAVKK